MLVVNFVDVFAFLAYGYAARAFLLPIEIGLSVLTLLAVLGMALTTPRQQPFEFWKSEWLWVLLAVFWLAADVGRYLHPNDQLREAMEARAAAK